MAIRKRKISKQILLEMVSNLASILEILYKIKHFKNLTIE